MANRSAPSSPALRNTCAIAAILGFGVVTGALLAETSLMSFRLSLPGTLLRRSSGFSQVNGYLRGNSLPGQSRRGYTQPRPLMAHRNGI